MLFFIQSEDPDAGTSYGGPGALPHTFLWICPHCMGSLHIHVHAVSSTSGFQAVLNQCAVSDPKHRDITSGHSEYAYAIVLTRLSPCISKGIHERLGRAWRPTTTFIDERSTTQMMYCNILRGEHHGAYALTNSCGIQRCTWFLRDRWGCFASVVFHVVHVCDNCIPERDRHHTYIDTSCSVYMCMSRLWASLRSAHMETIIKYSVSHAKGKTFTAKQTCQDSPLALEWNSYCVFILSFWRLPDQLDLACATRTQLHWWLGAPLELL